MHVLWVLLTCTVIDVKNNPTSCCNNGVRRNCPATFSHFLYVQLYVSVNLISKHDMPPSDQRSPMLIMAQLSPGFAACPSPWVHSAILCLRGTRSRPIHLSLDFNRALAECRIAPAAWLLYQSWLLYRFLLLPSLFWIHFLYYICHYINNYFSPIKRYKGTTGNLGESTKFNKN